MVSVCVYINSIQAADLLSQRNDVIDGTKAPTQGRDVCGERCRCTKISNLSKAVLKLIKAHTHILAANAFWNDMNVTVHWLCMFERTARPYVPSTRVSEKFASKPWKRFRERFRAVECRIDWIFDWYIWCSIREPSQELRGRLVHWSKQYTAFKQQRNLSCGWGRASVTPCFTPNHL